MFHIHTMKSPAAHAVQSRFDQVIGFRQLMQENRTPLISWSHTFLPFYQGATERVDTKSKNSQKTSGDFILRRKLQYSSHSEFSKPRVWVAYRCSYVELGEGVGRGIVGGESNHRVFLPSGKEIRPDSYDKLTDSAVEFKIGSSAVLKNQLNNGIAANFVGGLQYCFVQNVVNGRIGPSLSDFITLQSAGVPWTQIWFSAPSEYKF